VFFSRVDFTSFLNRLYLSMFLILQGNCLYNLTPICSTPFEVEMFYEIVCEGHICISCYDHEFHYFS